MSSSLFSPITLRGVTFANRIAVSPMCQYNSVDGSANDWHLMHLGSFSLGAAGLVITEMTNVNPVGRITHKCAGLWSDDNEAALKRVYEFCRTYGVAKLGVQLGHAGRKGSQTPPSAGARPLTQEEGAWETEAPSAIPFVSDGPAPRAMTKADIGRVVAEFQAAARRAARIGFDVIELHGGHGYLLHQFLSPLANQRDDEYGGSFENRIRFPLEVFRAVRSVVPDDKVVGIRLSANDWVEDGWTPDETVELAHKLKAAGCDYIDVSTGGLDLRQKIPMGPGYQVSFGERVRKEAGIKTMSVGLITEARQAEEIIASGKADFVALGRGVMYDPRWAWHAAEELGAETAYAPKMMACHPKMRPQVFPHRQIQPA
jgi:NADPH2 dehydrogenase